MFDSRGTIRMPTAADVVPYIRAADIGGDISVTPDPISDGLVLRFTVLGRPEELRFSSNIEPSHIVHAVWLLRETREAAVGPEFHMAANLARRNFAAVDPYGRPA